MPQDVNFTAGSYQLWFGLAPQVAQIGMWVESYRTTMKLANEVKVRQNFWATVTNLDGLYSTLYCEHTFLVYFESQTHLLFLEGYHQVLTTMYIKQPATLQLRGSPLYCPKPNGLLIDFGPSFFHQTTVMKEPEQLFYYRAGKIELAFISQILPVVTP